LFNIIITNSCGR